MSLTDTCGFFLCQNGYVDIIFNESTYHLQAGDIYIYAPSTYVSILNISDDVEGITVKCQMEFVLPLFEHVINGQHFLMMRDHPCISLTPKQLRRLEMLSDMVEDRQKALISYSAKGALPILEIEILSLAKAFFYEVLYDYASNQSIEPELIDSKDRIFQNFLISLFKNYKTQREVKFYADEQHLTPRYFSSIVKEKSGHSPSQWIMQIVVSNITHLLRNSDKSIKELSSEFHFRSQSFFGKYFKLNMGVSPKEFRQNL